MATEPKAGHASATADPSVTNAGPQGPAPTTPLPQPNEAVSNEATPTSSPARPTRAEWVRIAIFGIPYAAFFLVGVPTSLFPASWNLTAINLAIDTVLLIVVLAFFAREFSPRSPTCAHTPSPRSRSCSAYGSWSSSFRPPSVSPSSEAIRRLLRTNRASWMHCSTGPLASCSRSS